MASHLHWADYLVLIGFLVISLAIGIYHSLTGGRQKTVAEFILANRRLKVIPTAISLFVSLLSAITFLGMTAEMYGYGIQYGIFCLVAVLLALLFVERLIVPWLYPLKLVSMFEYLEMRYMSKSIRIFGATLGIITAVLLMGVAIYAPSVALESATGLPIIVSIPVMAVVSVTYTALGGMRAVIWTDVFQFLIMVIGMVAILVKGLIVAGGITNVFRLAGEEGRLVWANFSVDPRERNTVWSIVAGMTVTWIYWYGFSQASVQRISAVDRLSKARTTMFLNIPPLIIANALACIIGLIVLAYFSSIKCDPLANKDIANPNMLLPYFVVTIFADSPGFAGLFLSTLYGATLSTLSSSLSGAAGNCWEDILKWKLNHLQETRKALINRILVVLFGAVTIGVAFLASSFPGPIIQVAIAMIGSVNGPLIALFFLGGISKHANWKGMILGAIMGVSITLWLSLGTLTLHQKHPPLPPVSVEQCSRGNDNSTLFLSRLNKSTSFETVDGIEAKDKWNETTDVALVSGIQMTTQVAPLRGLENFYAISYLWLTLFGAIVTGVIGITASLIMRDKELEAMVDERFLMRVHGCGWSEHLDDNNHASHLGVKGVKRPEDNFFKDVELISLKKTDNGPKEDVTHAPY